jgi:hypothetical protein
MRTACFRDSRRGHDHKEPFTRDDHEEIFNLWTLDFLGPLPYIKVTPKGDTMACQIKVRNGGLNVTPETAHWLVIKGVIAPKEDELGVFIVTTDDELKIWKLLRER